jgi:hypothetical protein
MGPCFADRSGDVDCWVCSNFNFLSCLNFGYQIWCLDIATDIIPTYVLLTFELELGSFSFVYIILNFGCL